MELGKKRALTCCVLHDICDEHGDNFTEEHPDRTVNIQPPVQALSEHVNAEGADIRAGACRRGFSGCLSTCPFSP